MPRLVNVSRAAREFGLDRATVQAAVERGELPAIKIKTRFYLDPVAIGEQARGLLAPVKRGRFRRAPIVIDTGAKTAQ